MPTEEHRGPRLMEGLSADAHFGSLLLTAAFAGAVSGAAGDVSGESSLTALVVGAVLPMTSTVVSP